MTRERSVGRTVESKFLISFFAAEKFISVTDGRQCVFPREPACKPREINVFGTQTEDCFLIHLYFATYLY